MLLQSKDLLACESCSVVDIVEPVRCGVDSAAGHYRRCWAPFASLFPSCTVSSPSESGLHQGSEVTVLCAPLSVWNMRMAQCRYGWTKVPSGGKLPGGHPDGTKALSCSFIDSFRHFFTSNRNSIRKSYGWTSRAGKGGMNPSIDQIFANSQEAPCSMRRSAQRSTHVC